MPAATMIAEDQILVEARRRWVERERARCAEAMCLVADELEREWRADPESVVRFSAVTLARRMVRELEGEPSPVLALPAADAQLDEILVRFATAIRTVPAVSPEACPQCSGLGFVHVIADQGEICPTCGGERVLRFG